MRRIPLVLLLLLIHAVDPCAAESRNPPPEGLQLEGIYIGQPFADVDRLLDLRNHTPLKSDGGERYTWHPEADIDDLETLNNELDLAYRLRSIELVFRDERVSEVRASYATGILFARMGPDLERRYGKPSSVLAPPRRSVVGADGRTYLLWLQIWTWEWDDVTLTVNGEHYRPPQRPQNRYDDRYRIPERPREQDRQYLDFFRFHLTASPDSSSEP